MKPLIGGRLLSIEEGARLSLQISNLRMAMVDSMERDQLIKAIAQQLYRRNLALGSGDTAPKLQARRTHSRGRGGFHFSDLYR